MLARDDPEANANLRFQLPENRETLTDVTTYSLTAGLEGSISSTDFTWEGFMTHGVSSTFARQTGIYPSGNSAGLFDVHEIDGELLVPVLSDIPGIMEFNLQLDGRVSDYSTTGTSFTYKVLGDWRVTNWLRFRGGYNRAERAPTHGPLAWC